MINILRWQHFNNSKIRLLCLLKLFSCLQMMKNVVSRTTIHSTLWRQTHSLGTAVSFGKIHLPQGNHGISCSQNGHKIPPIPCGINSDLYNFRLAICLFTASWAKHCAKNQYAEWESCTFSSHRHICVLLMYLTLTVQADQHIYLHLPRELLVVIYEKHVVTTY